MFRTEMLYQVLVGIRICSPQSVIDVGNFERKTIFFQHRQIFYNKHFYSRKINLFLSKTTFNL